MELLWRLVRLVGLALLHVVCTVRNTWLWVEYSFQDSGMIFFRSSVASIKARRRGTKPSAPTVLGVVIAHPMLVQQDQTQATECKLLDLFEWAQTNGFRLILLYDASGKLCDTYWVDRLHQKSITTGKSKKFCVWVGWAVPSDWWMEYECTTGSNSKALPLGISLLSPSDGEWPLIAASRAAAKLNASDDTTQDGLDNDAFHIESSIGSALCRALNAPDTLKTQLSAVSGPLVTVEPQVIFVFGDFPTMAGFPSWTIRNAEFFQLGRLLRSDKSKFDAILRRYMKVRQRFGK